jgi:PAS domain S-box-containing protein
MHFKDLGDRKRLFALVLVMVATAAIVAAAWGWRLYLTSIDDQRTWLSRLVATQAEMIDAVARFDAEYGRHDYPEGATAATISQIKDAYEHSPGFGESGEFVVGQHVDDTIIFLSTNRHLDGTVPEPVAFGQDMAEPMYRALQGESGTTIGLDYRGVQVLAAYDPVTTLDIAIVAKIDLSEIRAPYLQAVYISVFIAVFAIGVGGWLTFNISQPMLARLASHTKELNQVNINLEFQKHAMDEHAIVSVADIKGDIIYVNEKFCQISGFSSEELIGNNHRMIKSSEHPPELYTDLWRTIASGKTWTGEIKNRKSNGGHYWVKSTIVPFVDEKGTPFQYVSIRTDITTEKEKEIALYRATEAAETANRTKSEFLATMSHDLRTPLNAIIGFSDLMRTQTFGPLNNSNYEQYANDIHFSGELLVNLVDDVLDLAKIEAGKYEMADENIDVAILINDCLRMMTTMVESSNLTLDASIPPNMPVLRGDKKAVAQVLNNILSNAMKFTPDGGSINILANVSDGGGIAITVSDTGIGMSENDISKALRPFEQADAAHTRRHEGTGLGLSICDNFMKLFGGSLHIESKLDEGTKVTIQFPVKRSIHAT